MIFHHVNFIFAILKAPLVATLENMQELKHAEKNLES